MKETKYLCNCGEEELRDSLRYDGPRGEHTRVEGESCYKPRNYTGAETYFDSLGKDFEPWGQRAYLSIEVLQQFKGKPWDDLALSYVSALRPSVIRVIRWGQGMKANAHTWRVTVHLDENEKIRKINQEVEVCVPKGCTTGYSIMMAAQYGISSPQTEWCNKRGGMTLAFGEFYKTLEDGTILHFPK